MTDQSDTCPPAMPAGPHLAVQPGGRKNQTPPPGLAGVARHILMPALPDALRHPALEAAAQDCLALLPDGDSSFFGLEIPLDRVGAGFDVLACLTAREGSGAGLRASLLRDRAAGQPTSPAWSSCLDLLRSWADGEARGMLDRLWLEFDLRAGGEAAASPNLFFGPADGVAPEAFASRILDWLDRLSGSPADPRRAAAIRRLALTPGEGARVFQVGVMVARPGLPKRLCFRCIPPVLDSGILDALRDTEAATILRREAAWLAPLADRLDVVVDVAPNGQVLPRLGLEAWFEPGRGDPAHRVGARRLLEELVARGLCAPAFAALLPEFGGLATRPASGFWPASMALAEALTAGAQRGFVMWGLHHIKIAAGPDGLREAKAYLYCACDFLPTSAFPAASAPPRANHATGDAFQGSNPLAAAKRAADAPPMTHPASPAPAAANESACSAAPASSSPNR